MIHSVPKIDLSFRISGKTPLWCDHGYILFAAISKVLPAIHHANGIGVLPIAGQQMGERKMQLLPQSRLTLRITSGDITNWLPLAGELLDVGGSDVQVGVPEIRSLLPSTALRSRLVTTKNCQDQARFELELRKQMTAIGVSEQALFSIGKRRTIRIRDKEVVGYETIVEGLTADESIAIQSVGIGGRKHMGCGMFVPLLPRGVS